MHRRVGWRSRVCSDLLYPCADCHTDEIVTQMNKLGQPLCGSLDSFGRVSFHVPVCVCDCFAGGTRNDRPDRALLVVLMMTKLALPS